MISPSHSSATRFACRSTPTRMSSGGSRGREMRGPNNTADRYRPKARRARLRPNRHRERSYGCAFVNGIEFDGCLFSGKDKEGQTGAGGHRPEQQGERFIPQAVYAHIRGLTRLRRLTSTFLNHRGLIPQVWVSSAHSDALARSGLTHNVVEDGPLPDLSVPPVP